MSADLWELEQPLAMPSALHSSSPTMPPRQSKRGIDPAAPRFIPGVELPHQHGILATMNHHNSSVDSALHQSLVKLHVQRTGELMAIQDRVDTMEAEITKNYVPNHLFQALVAKLNTLEVKLCAKTRLDEQSAEMMSILDSQTPTPKMLATYDTNAIADAYAKQIDFYKKLLARLQDEYLTLSSDNNLVVGGPIKVNSATSVPSPVSMKQECSNERNESTSATVQDGDEGTQLSTVQTSNTTDTGPQSALPWMPLAVQQMPQPPTENINSSRTFSWEFLMMTLGGEQWSPGFYFVTKASTLPTPAYWVLEGDYEPFLPKQPGQHGAKLTAFFNDASNFDGDRPDESCFLSTPVFVRAPGAIEYVYFGHYSQKRSSDKIGYDHMMQRVPPEIRRYWAKQLVEPDRPQWVTDRLMLHFWPQPQYTGPIPRDMSVAKTTESSDSGHDDDVIPEVDVDEDTISALQCYARQLIKWKEEAKGRVKALTAEFLEAAFERADFDSGLRLWWEYLEFEEFNQEFYDEMVGLKKKEEEEEKEEEPGTNVDEKEASSNYTVKKAEKDEKTGSAGSDIKPAKGSKLEKVPTTEMVETNPPSKVKARRLSVENYVPPHLRPKKG